MTNYVRVPVVTLFGVLALIGCQSDEIRHYRAPRTDEPAVRLIAALFTQGEKAWVFKLQGPEGEIAARADAFTAFVRSVRFAEKADPPVTWKLPDNWKLEGGAPGANMGRFATIRTGPKDGDPLLTVSQLIGPEAGNILANVNRWRGQLGLRPLPEASLVQVCKKLTVEGAGEATLVDMSGPGASKAPPMMDKALPTVPADRKPFTYSKPDSWTEFRDPKGVATVAFHAGEGNAVEITVTRLPGPAGGLTANINRWRAQIGLPEASTAEIQATVRDMKVAGEPANYVDLLGPDAGAGPRQRIIGVILSRGQLTWFFKMRGPADRLAREQAAFDAFIGTVRFDGTGGE